MELLNVVRKSPLFPSGGAEKKALERRQKSFLLSESERSLSEEELNKKKAIMGSLWCDQSTFTVSFKLDTESSYRIHFFITLTLYYFSTKKNRMRDIFESVENPHP